MGEILNDRQFRITKSWHRKFDAGPEFTDAQLEKLSSKMVQAIRNAHRSQAKDLESEMAEYERLKNAAPEDITLQTLVDLPRMLIKLRIMRGFTQKRLAKQLDISEQQIQRYEKNEYQGVRFRRIVEITQALEIDLSPTSFLDRK